MSDEGSETTDDGSDQMDDVSEEMEEVSEEMDDSSEMIDEESEKVVEVSPEGETTIPKEFREEFDIETPGKIKFVRTDDGGLAVQPIEGTFGY